MEPIKSQKTLFTKAPHSIVFAGSSLIVILLYEFFVLNVANTAKAFNKVTISNILCKSHSERLWLLWNAFDLIKELQWFIILFVNVPMLKIEKFLLILLI